MNQELVNCCGNCNHVTIINCGKRPLCRKSEMEADYHCEVDGKAHSVFDSCDNFEERARCYIKVKEDKCPNVYSLFGTYILFDSRSEACPAMYAGDGKQFRMIAKFADAEDVRMVEGLLGKAVTANIEAYRQGYEDGKDAGYTEGLKEGWISVSERLPEVKCYEEKYVLVTDGEYVTDGCAMRLNDDDPVDLSASHIDSSRIVAWMPMSIPNIKGKTMGDIWEERARREK